MIRPKSLVVLCSILFVVYANSQATPLDDYVNTPDPHYNYELIQTYSQVGYKVYVLNMTSQKWMDETVVENPIWWHYVVITVPDKVTRGDAAFMFIQGGTQTWEIPTPEEQFVKIVSLFSASTGAIGVNLFQIPNQPTVFLSDPQKKRRTEDAVIAWTWKMFIDNINEPNILLRLPMTKAAVRAMDATIDFVAKQNISQIKKFMVAGGSKRGWTTWTTAAVDKRVYAAIPIVMDLLDINTNLHANFRALGGWTFEFDDYYSVNITSKVDSPEIFAMAKIIDPKSYLDRFRNTKLLVVNTAGDEFFLPDNTHAYWPDLVAATNGSVLLRRLPNAEHTCAGHTMSLFFTFRSFFLTTYENQPQPLVRWLRPNNRTHGIITVMVDIQNGLKPSDVEVYFAKTLSTTRRDFRLAIAKEPGSTDGKLNPVFWEKTTSILVKNETSTTLTYSAAFLKPISGWLGFFIQLSFPAIENSELIVTTETNVIPEEFPFGDCTLESCFGTLV